MAGQRLTDKTALEQQTGSGDLFMVVDVNDTTGSAAGTSKKIDSKYIIQTDKISVSNAEVQDLHNNEKILVGALSGYMITPISATCLITYAASTESSNKNIYFGFDDSVDTHYWDTSSRFMGGQSTDVTYIFGGRTSGSGTKSTSILNSPFAIWSNGAFNGGWSMDVYITYAYTKVL
jgi:hypothetical protein